MGLDAVLLWVLSQIRERSQLRCRKVARRVSDEKFHEKNGRYSIEGGRRLLAYAVVVWEREPEVSTAVEQDEEDDMDILDRLVGKSVCVLGACEFRVERPQTSWAPAVYAIRLHMLRE